jgi:UDP-glucose 4-epimerase
MTAREAAAPRVLVTGGAGFIGSHTVDRLVAEGAVVVVLDDFSTGREDNLARWADDPRVQTIYGDICAGLAAPLARTVAEHGGFDVVVHLAAQVSVERSVIDPLADIRINYCGTAQVLEYARSTGIGKIVFSSSSAVYGDGVPLPIQEDANAQPLSAYGVDKLASEHLIHCYQRAWGVRSTVFRFFNVYGPRQSAGSPYSGVISSFVDRAMAGQPLTIYGDGEQTRDFVFVGDVARAIAAACFQPPAADAVLNLGSGIETSVNRLARTILEITGATGELRHAPPRAGEIRRSVACVRRARESGCHPTTSLADGLRQTIQTIRGAHRPM